MNMVSFPIVACARLRASRTIIAVPKDDKILVYNFLTRMAALCSTDTLYWISYFHNWAALDEAAASHPHLVSSSVEKELGKLEETGILLRENTAALQREELYIKDWEWGLAAGLFHFSLTNNEFLEPSEAQRRLLQKAAHCPSPSLFWRNEGSEIAFDRAGHSRICGLLSIMERRRTNRTVACPAISKEQLGDCLYAGLAITGHVETPTGHLPLSMTPSGGARNPFEAFVIARNVTGVDPGIYHYSAIDNSVALVAADLPDHSADLLAGQEWADQMPAIVILVAVLERTMWKYSDPNSYRVVLIEAGHIGQNIMLAATAHGLTACPTAALNHDLVSRHLGITKITHSPIYALTLSVPGEYDAPIHANAP